MPIYRLNASIGVRHEELGVHELLDGKDDAVTALDANRRSRRTRMNGCVSTRRSGILLESRGAMGWVDGRVLSSTCDRRGQ